MTIQAFVKKAIQQDQRNVFGESEEVLDLIPEELNEFYSKANPLDVEINIDGNSVKMYPMDELKSLQEDYSLEDGCFVFATCNSDPIFVYEGKIYTCYHGSKDSEKEFMADDFDSFMEMID